MTLFNFMFLAGIWLSLIYSAAVMPATVWSIQITVSRGFWAGSAAALGLSMGQIPWALVAGLLLLQFPQHWQAIDTPLRVATITFLAWVAFKSARALPVRALRLVIDGSTPGIFRDSFLRSLTMPWRLPIWAALIVVMSVHLRGPGWEAAIQFSMGALIGQLAWFLHFNVIAGLFGHRVPEHITLHSMNKFRILATIVPVGLALVCLAPMVIE
jgi:threonine/homoserine/homoserine lactone efflux protein